MRARPALLLVLLVTATSYAAGAQPASVDSAEKAFQKGLTLSAATAWSDALASFEEAGAVRMTPQIRYHIARCHEHLGNLVEALGGLRLAAAQATDPLLKERIEAARADMETRVPRIRIHGSSTDAQVTLDGLVLTADALTSWLPRDPGRHVIVVRRGGQRVIVRELTLAERDSESVDVSVRVVADSTSGSASTGERSLLAPAVLAGVGVIGLGASAAFFALREAKLGDLDSACTSARVCDKSLEPKRESAVTFTWLSAGSLAVGAVACAAAAYFYFHPSKAQSAAIGLGVSSLTLRGRF